MRYEILKNNKTCHLRDHSFVERYYQFSTNVSLLVETSFNTKRIRSFQRAINSSHCIVDIDYNKLDISATLCHYLTWNVMQ
jgi:hypothetical protein